MYKRRIIFIVAAIFLGGCAVPMVSYKHYSPDRPATEPDLDGNTKFRLASSIVMVEPNKDAKTGIATDLKFRSTPVEDASGDTYAIVSEDRPGVRSNIGVEAYQNTRLIKIVTTNLEDKRIDLIKQAGSVITKLVGFAAGASAGKFPDDFQEGTIDFSKIFAEKNSRDALTFNTEAVKDILGSELIGTGNAKATILSITLSAAPPDSTPKANYPYMKRQRTLFFSSCREAKIALELSGQQFQGTVQVADPNFLQTVALPVAGNVETHSACGVSVKASKATTSSDLQVIEAVIDQAKSIRDAQKPAKKDAKK